ncbi:rhomboid family intramembrane serine protease [Dysgonomonas sp. 520]|uniref:rhomboid family protein n=1 Tax=Dysgonomonas sp. 520 TaxID=2302931 RepID=UPI0013D35CCD|nr:rhomboid family intramembrane serine protease [Dysgonomonas sp. 520]NDW10406.1 rhomboid family intramembrane serine protease [Dysgonomonas sp. 520]
MADIINDIKNKYKKGNILTKYIFINIAVFLLLFVLTLIRKLAGLEVDIESYVAIPSGLQMLIYRPWTLITYIFVHFEIFHILFNMLFLYWFGQLFLMYFTPKNFGSLYILGGLGGAVLYLLIYNLIPYFSAQEATMVGASASAMAIMFGVAFYVPDLHINMLFVGRIKILYVAITLFIMDLLFFGLGENLGGHISHIGGAAVGYAFAKMYISGKDITRWMSNVIDRTVNLFKPSPKKKMTVKPGGKNETDYEYNQRRARQTEEIDAILDKIKASGYSSLSKDEKKKLFDASKN